MFVKANAAQCVGCLLGGAIGDALGAPIEFLTLAQIRERFGKRGVDGKISAVLNDSRRTVDSIKKSFFTRGAARFYFIATLFAPTRLSAHVFYRNRTENRRSVFDA